jgi:D-3-phosphoglycerate dehydrogenase
MAFLSYVDRPGVIGAFGRLLGDAGVNIAGMQVSRNEQGGSALVVLTLDSEIPAEVLTAIGNEVNATLARVADLDD